MEQERKGINYLRDTPSLQMHKTCLALACTVPRRARDVGKVSLEPLLGEHGYQSGGKAASQSRKP
jgi:hypothetical protein